MIASVTVRARRRGVLLNQTETERRRHPRVVVALEVGLDVGLEAATPSRVVPCRSVNVSLGGARVRSPSLFDVGQKVLATIAAEDRVFTTFADVLDSAVAAETGDVDLRLRFWEMSPQRRDGLTRLLETAAEQNR